MPRINLTIVFNFQLHADRGVIFSHFYIFGSKTFLYLWIKNCLKHIAWPMLILGHCLILITNARIGEGFIVINFSDAEILNTTYICLLPLKRFVHLKHIATAGLKICNSFCNFFFTYISLNTHCYSLEKTIRRMKLF